MIHVLGVSGVFCSLLVPVEEAEEAGDEAEPEDLVREGGRGFRLVSKVVVLPSSLLRPNKVHPPVVDLPPVPGECVEGPGENH